MVDILLSLMDRQASYPPGSRRTVDGVRAYLVARQGGAECIFAFVESKEVTHEELD